MKHTLACSLFLIVTLFHSLVRSEPVEKPTYHCKDESSWHEWHALLEKHPSDDSIYTLYALRLGLCSMVEAGNIDKNRAINIFEDMRSAVIRYHKDGESDKRGRKEGT